MKNIAAIQKKILNLSQAQHIIAAERVYGHTIAFTNGCFDILHDGHIYSLSQAAAEADLLIVGVNADSSVKKLKGDSRPINNEQSRALVLASLEIVDIVIIFDEDTPLNLITGLSPDVLVKGGDYTTETVVGAKEVLAKGGRVVINKLLDGFSTTALIERIKKA
ncbi:MAG TPA: D-glycero-beta-D-manno-heptose 1-phosphate adenylyltransferase [Chitinophagaceae bacterium]|nr:D-glycero-beta-D-manno-heptose 1-phosphate adenylyltransferase [Chitinophagaceae bacterium]